MMKDIVAKQKIIGTQKTKHLNDFPKKHKPPYCVPQILWKPFIFFCVDDIRDFYH